MKKEELEAFGSEAAKSIKSEKDLSDFSRMLKKITAEAALNDHNAMTSTSPLKTATAVMVISAPEYKQHQLRLTGMDDKIHCLEDKGMTTREIKVSFKAMCDVDVSASLSSTGTNAIISSGVSY